MKKFLFSFLISKSSSKEENFLDLSVDVEQNTSISHCLQEFSNMEMLCGECKYYCETCGSKQEAEKRMRIKRLPKVLALHLKRFKFVGQLNKFKKLTYRVVFPFELRLFNTVSAAFNEGRCECKLRIFFFFFQDRRLSE